MLVRYRLIIVATLVLAPFVRTLQAQDEDPPARVARIGYLSGDVSLLYPGAPDWSEAPPNYPMFSGARLYAGDDGRAAIQNGSIDVRIWQDTDVTLTNLADNYEQLGLAQGSIRVRIYSLEQDGTVEVDTPNGAVIVQQPGDYRVNAYPDQGGSLVEVNAGSVQIAGPDVNQEVDQGEAVQLSGSNPIQVGMVEMPGFDDLDNWSVSRDRHIMNSVSARYVSREMPGYDDLDDNGSWSQAPDYGPVWYPSNMPAGWAPYTFGHWAYVDPWGWTWVDDTSWGYAPFHYGRWAAIDGRWGWVPGPPEIAPVYSPALVAFVGGGPGFSIGVGFGGGGVAAWFPIGVGEPYVPWYRCSPAYVRTVNVTNINITYIHNTTIVNNYNTFISNTRTVNNVTQIQVNNIQYANRNNVVAVSANSMSAGARVQHSQVQLNPQERQQLARTPVSVARPPVAAPARPMLQAKANISRPVAAPRLLTPHGPAAATPVANTARFNPASLPRPQPAAAIRPATRTIAPNLKPASPSRTGSQPAAVPQPGRPGTPAQENRPAQMPEEPNRPAPNAPQPRPAIQQPEQNQVHPGLPQENPGNGNPARPPNEETQPRTQPAQPRQYEQPPAPHSNPQPAIRPQPAEPPPNTARPEQQSRPQERQAPPPAPPRATPPPPQAKPAPQEKAAPEPKKENKKEKEDEQKPE